MGWLMSWKKPCSRHAEWSSSAIVGDVNEMMGRLKDAGVGTIVKIKKKRRPRLGCSDMLKWV